MTVYPESFAVLTLRLLGARVLLASLPIGSASAGKERSVVRRLIRMALLPALLALPGTALGATVRGVVSEQGRPIVGAAVLVDGILTVPTDRNGAFLARLGEGAHTLRVDLHGYPPQQRTLIVPRDGVTQADFSLEPLLRVSITNAPRQLARRALGTVAVAVTNSTVSAYSLDAAGLNLFVAGVDHTAEFAVRPDFENPTVVPAGGAVTLVFTLIPTARAPVGPVTLRASLFAFDTAFGRNLLPHPSCEPIATLGRPFPWFFATDNPRLAPDADGALFTGPAMTGLTAAKVWVPVARTGGTRTYCDNTVRIQPGKQYVLSGYIKTENVVSTEGGGASLNVPITGTPTYQEPTPPWLLGTRDWRKSMVAFQPGDRGTRIEAHCRGVIQQARGVAWFDNFALTEGPVDASLTVTSPEQSLEVTGE